MGKDSIKNVGLGATEGALKSLVPGLQEALVDIRNEIRSVRDRMDVLENRVGDKLEAFEEKLAAKLQAVEDKLELRIEALRQEMLDRFEATRDTINELGQRIARVEGALEAYARMVNSQFAQSRSGAPSKKRRAG